MTNTRDRKRCMFTKDETMLIINLWKDDKIQTKFKSTLKHNFIWNQLSRELNEFGYNKTGEEIKRKIQNLKHEYKAIKQISEHSLKSWPYYNVMTDLMERKATDKNNVHIEDDHDYVESEIQEIDEQSSSGSWMLMELKDISQTNTDNFQEVEDPINTITTDCAITIDNLEESDAQSDVNMIEIENTNTIKTKVKSESVLKNPLPLFAQVKVEDVSNQTLPVRKSRRPLRFKAHPDRRILRTSHHAQPHQHSHSHSHVTEDRVMERIDEREKRINEREVRLEERERRIDDRERRIDERERRVEENERNLRERERRFEDRDKKYEEREANSSTSMCRFFDTCSQFLNQYTSPVISQNCEVDETQTF